MLNVYGGVPREKEEVDGGLGELVTNRDEGGRGGDEDAWWERGRGVEIVSQGIAGGEETPLGGGDGAGGTRH